MIMTRILLSYLFINFFFWLSLPFDIIPTAEEADEVTENITHGSIDHHFCHFLCSAQMMCLKCTCF